MFPDRQWCELGVYHVPLSFHVYMDVVMKKVKMGTGRREMRFQEEEREWRLPGLLYVDDLVLCGESEEDLRAMAERFVEVCRRRNLKVNAGKVMALGWEEGAECEVRVDGMRLEHVSEFKYLRCVLNESGTYEAKGSRMMASGRKVVGAMSDLQLECTGALHESLLVSVLMYGSRGRGLGLRLYRWTTSKVCWV